VRGQLFAIVGGLVAVVGRLPAVARGQVAIARGLLAVDLRSLTVAPCPAHGLLGAAGSVAEVGEAVASVRRKVALGRRGVALGGRGVAFGRGVVTRLGDTSALVGPLVTFAGRATARFAAALMAGLPRGPVAIRLAQGRRVRFRSGLVAIRPRLVLV
jgi:hypothetical protein